MPTVGWIREDALEAFYEGTERTPDPGPPAKPTFRCPFCISVFSIQKELHDHVYKKHRVERPVMLLGGTEPSGRTVVRVPMGRSQVGVANATTVQISIDGRDPENCTPDAVPKKVAEARQAEMNLVLLNDSQANAQPVSTRYKISFRIADASELRRVEDAFAATLVSSSITRDTIGRFLSDPRTQGPGSEYASGLANYCLGILLKERPEAENLTTPFSRYRENYGSALQVLADFDRPLARLITGVVRFALNDFSGADSSTGYWELDFAKALLSDPSRASMPSLDGDAKRRPICPVDHGTARILDLATRMAAESRWSPILDDECREIANSEVLDATDHEKALAIWAAAALRTGSSRSAIEPLTQIAAVYPFNSWAEQYLENVSK
ncbi:hypothetical protein [Sinorhizobium fredii]|uniref:hypothetical protein n=1 Tax=Rhizobium fredii TaxID=380 RepID=UPI0012FE6D5F|nr:hypothetical protein [Sinorhizobium fredii]